MVAVMARRHYGLLALLRASSRAAVGWCEA